MVEVDRMKSISILCSDAVPQPKDFNLPDFTRQVFDMYDGTKEKVTLLCKNELMNYIVDKFGDEVETSPTDDSHFKAVVEESVSQTFFAWVFQFNGEVKIANPSAVRGAIVESTPATLPVQEPQAITEEAMLNYMVQNPEFLQKFKVLLGVGN